MPEFNLNYENISVDYNANKEDTAGGNTLGGGDIILVDIHGGEGGSFAEIDESNLAGGGKTIAGWGVGGIGADDDDGDHDIIFDPDGDLLPPNKPTGGGGDDAPDSILWDLDGGHVPGGGSEYLVHGVDGETNGQELVFGLSASGDYADTGMHDGTDSSGHDPIADMLSR